MGNSTPKEGRKKLVIIGGNFTGILAFQLLHKHLEILVIDSKDYYEQTPSLHFYFTNQIPHENISLRYEESILKGSFLHAKAIELQPNRVIVRTATEEKGIDFDFCLIATGSSYPSLFKPGTDLKTLADRRNQLEPQKQKVTSSKKVLVKGNGVVGTEVAAELASQGKEVVLLSKTGTVLPHFSQKVQTKALTQLQTLGVKLGSPQDYENKADQFDLVYECTGNIYPTDDNILNKNFSGYRDASGRVKVNEFLQIVNDQGVAVKNIFSAGDANITALKEEKNIPNLQVGVKVAAHNIKELALKGSDANPHLKSFPNTEKKLALISVGPKSILVMGNSVYFKKFLTKMKKGYGVKVVKKLRSKSKA